MSTSSPTAPTVAEADYRLKTTRYDRVASLLVTLLILVGAAVLIMLIAWLSSRLFAPQTAVPVQLEQIGTGDNALREGPDLDTPPAEEIRQEVDLNPPQIGETLVAVTAVVSRNAAQFDDPSMDRAMRPGGGRLASGGRPGRPRAWEVLFDKGNTLENYAKQLDFFGIELGVLLPDNKVVYAYDLANARPSTREGPADQEQRYYLTWRQGELEGADRELLGRAGIDPKNRLILKFIPPKWEGVLAKLEKDKAGAEFDNVRRSRFRVKPTASGYDFELTEQFYR